MALPATLVCECRSGGNDLNGGGFDSAGTGTDRSLQDAAHVVIDGATISAVVGSTTTWCNLTGYTVVAADQGNVVNITGGTATAGRYLISSVDTGNNRWVLDRAIGTAAQTIQGIMGGAVKFPAVLTNTTGTTLVPGTKVWIKNDGPYTLTTATPGAGGPMSVGNIGTTFEGYETTRGDRGEPPVIDAGVLTSLTIIASASANNIFTLINVKVDGNNNSTVVGFDTGSRSTPYHCVATRCTTGFQSVSQRSLNCFADTCVTGFSGGNLTGCVAKSCTTGFNLSNTNTAASDCVAYSCTGDGFVVSVGCSVDNCSSYGNGGDGFDLSATTCSMASNCVATGNTGYGFNTPASVAGQQGCRLILCAAYSNTAGNVSNALQFNDGFVTLSADPFTNAASGDFSLNNTSGGGAALRGIGLDPYGQTGYQDIGAVQHGDPASSGGYYVSGL